MAATLLWDDETSGQKPQENSLQDLFVFGYACKLFRDDEKAKFIDEGRHLIPWMGDERLMIDRYDGRGHLYDLTRYDADLVKGMPVELTEEEKAVEAACDEERYLELVTDVQEKAMYEEEEWKRYYESLHEGTYNAVGFSYDQSKHLASQPQGEEAGKEEEEEEEEAFVPPAQLMVPENVSMPQTQKEHARIERTATFIAKHGGQMEIMLKMKQSKNAQFEFLNFEQPLNQYYQHLLKMIKSGKYRPEHQQEQKKELETTEQHYLHPSLSTTTITPLPPPPPVKPIVMPKFSIEDTAYGQLLSSLRKYHKPKEEEKRDVATPPLPPFMAQPDYGSSSTPLDTLPSSHGHTAAADSVQPPTVKEEIVEPPPPGTEVMGPLPQPTSQASVQGCENRSSPQPQIIPPPPDVQPIIDRMAMYVAKNGVEFEFVVKSKNDQRFAFLEPGHVHFQYYDFKKNMFLKEAELKKRLEAKQMERERLKQEEEAAAAAAQANRSISFSIKGRNKDPESVSALKRPLFDYDSSEGEGEGEDGGGKEMVVEKESKSRSVSPEPGQAAPVASTSVTLTPAAPVTTSEVRPVAAEDVEKKQAEERLKDKLATAARDKLAACTKEKQLQAERKKKAAMFINLLRIVKESPASADKDGETEAKSSASVTPICSKPASPVPEVFEYNNRSGTPTMLNQDLVKKRKASRSRSPPPATSRKKRRKKSRTPPSAYANPMRSPQRFNSSQRHSPRRGVVGSRRMSPIRPFRSRRSPSPVGRERSPLGRRSPPRKKAISKRSRSRSQSPSQSKHKKKHKRSRSKTPKKKKKDKTVSGSRDHDSSSKSGRSHDKSTDKHKDRDKKKDKEKKKDRDKKEKDRKDRDKKDKKEKEKKDKKEKDRHKSKDSSDKHSSSSSRPGKSREKTKDSSRQTKPPTSTLPVPEPKPHHPPSPLPTPKPDPEESKAPPSPVPEIISSSSSDSSSSSEDEGLAEKQRGGGEEEGAQAGEEGEGRSELLPQANGQKASEHSGSQNSGEHVDLT